jgi:regulator of cell morphogenesis and NO signaling
MTASSRVAEIASLHPEAGRVFEHHQISYCCGDNPTVAEASAQRHLDPRKLLAEIEEAVSRSREDLSPWTRASLAEIIRQVASRYHARLHDDLPFVARLAARVEQSHAGRTPEVVETARVCAVLRGALEEHTAKEERILFPIILQLEESAGKRRPPVRTLEPVLESMTREHDTIAAALAHLRKATRSFTAPQGACQSIRALWHALARLERGLVHHMRIEDEVLFTRALELERLALRGGR